MPTTATPASDDGGALLLYGVFRTLIARQVPLSVSDYLDAIRILGQELRGEDLASVVSRGRLRRLCEVLWTRGPEEVRLLHRIFDGIAPPSAEDVAEIRAQLAALAPTPPPQTGQTVQPGAPAANPVGAGADAQAANASSDPGAAARAAISFESVGRAGGLPLPRPRPGASSTDAWVLQPQTVLSARALAILWRRYRRMTRVGPRTEFDLDATFTGYVQRGVLDRPVYRARRTNAARLLILADASASMAPWYPFLTVLGESLRLSRLRGAELWY